MFIVLWFLLIIYLCHSNPPVFWVGAGAAELNTLAGESLPPYFLLYRCYFLS
jgi:hypothetical protein